jgi:hypothetical protein
MQKERGDGEAYVAGWRATEMCSSMLHSVLRHAQLKY